MRVDAVFDVIRAVHFGIGSKEAVPDSENISVVGISEWLSVMVVHLVHVWRDEDIRESPIHLARHVDVGVGQVSKQHRQTLIKHHNTDRDADQKDAQDRKEDSEQRFAGMMAQPGGNVNGSIAMMDQVKFPHPFHFMLNPVDEPRAHKIEQHHAKNDLNPQRHLHEVKQPEFIGGNPGGCGIKHARQAKSNDGGEKGKGQVDTGMSIFVISKLEKRNHALHHPENKDSADENSGAEGGGNIFKETDDGFKHIRKGNLLV